jgi:predicted transposase/invertase (TIGR01784 family)
MTKQLSAHDRFTRSLMTHSKVSEEFFKEHLPTHLHQVIDFSSIKLHKESFIDDKLKLQIADLLFSANFNGESGFLYLLFEHASTSAPFLPLRIHKYMISIMDEHVNKKGNKKLPLIYPMILYSGKKPYAHSMDLFDLFHKKEKDLAKDILTSPYHLIDLAKTPDEKLRDLFWFGTMASALKHIHDPDILHFVMEIFPRLKQLEKQGEESYIYTMMTYIVDRGNVPRKQELIDKIKQLESIDEEKLMTLADHLKPEVFKRGMEKGLEQGFEKGIEKGIEKGRIEMARALLLKGIDIEIISETTGLSSEEIKKFYS